METHQSEMKIQSNRINDLVQRRNSQSVFQTQQQLDGANRKLVQLQSHRDNLDMSSVYQLARKGGSLHRKSKTNKKLTNNTRLPNIYNMNIEQNL